MRVQLQPSFVLHTRPYRDTSLLVDLFTREYGRLSLVARGARGNRSRGGSLAALLQPFAPLLCSWSGKRELKTLTAAESDSPAFALAGEYLFSGMYINELMVRMLHHEDPHQRLYDQYRQAIEELNLGAELDLCLRGFEFRLLEELGYGFDLSVDGLSGEPLLGNRWYSFHQEYGLVELQEAVVTATTDRVNEGMPRYLGAELLQITRGEFTPESRQCAKRLMRQALAAHLGDKPLRSRDLFRRRL